MNLFDFFSDELAPKYPSKYEDKESYYLQFIESTELDYYLTFFSAKEEEKKKIIATDQSIKLFDIDFKSGTETILKNMGSARFKSSYKKDGLKTTVLFYKKQFYSYKAIVQFHFINNQLVFGSLIIPHHNNQTISALSKLLSIKYSESLSNKLESSIVVDSDNNRIFYSNYFYPTLIYIGNNVQQIKPMLKKSTESKIFRIQKHLSAWYERL